MRARRAAVSVADDVTQAPAHTARRAARAELSDVAAALLAEFSASIPAGTIIRQLALAREHVLSTGVRVGLADAAEAITRVRLHELMEVGEVG